MGNVTNEIDQFREFEHGKLLRTMTIRTRRSSVRPRKSRRRPTRPSVNSLAIAEAYGIGPTSARDKSKCPTARVPSRAHSVEISDASGVDRPRRKTVATGTTIDHRKR